MKLGVEEALSQSLELPDQFLRIVVDNLGRNAQSALRTVLMKCTQEAASALCEALINLTDLAVDALKKSPSRVPLDAAAVESRVSVKRSAPMHIPSERRTRVVQVDDARPREAAETKEAKNVRRCEGGRQDVVVGEMLETDMNVVAVLRACVKVAQSSICEDNKCRRVFVGSGLLRVLKSLHDILVLLEDYADLQDSIARLCEQWWCEEFPGREAIVAQSLPYLLSKSLASNRKVDVRRVCLMRDALALLDLSDDSAGDLKNLLMRCVVTPLYLRTADGQRFITFLLGLNGRLVKELACIVFSQIPYGRTSILHAYGRILYRAWKVGVGPCLFEIEHSCIQRLIEGALHASTKALASSARKVLESFTCHRAEEGVEGMLFRLHEPLLFRALQVANSNVRRNALLLLIDMFPLQDPEAPKEEKEALLEKQFMLLEKLLFDTCPDIRSVAVEGACRILKLFWEIIPPAYTVRIISKVVHEIAKDKSSSIVRLAVLQGMTYLLQNAYSHSLLRALLPTLAPMLKDPVLNVRLGAADLLLAIRDIRSIKFYKVAHLDMLLSSLATDSDAVARRLTRLLIPSYFPSKIPITDACKRCFALIKRSPEAGGRFCAWALAEGASPASLLDLAGTFCKLVHCSPSLKESNEHEGILVALAELCNSMASSDVCKKALVNLVTGEMLNSLFHFATTPRARSCVLRLASLMPPPKRGGRAAAAKLQQYCNALITNLTPDLAVGAAASHQEVKAVHAFVLARGGFDDLISTFIALFSRALNDTTLASTSTTSVVLDAANHEVVGPHNKRGTKRRKAPFKNKKAYPSQTDEHLSSVGSVAYHGTVYIAATWAAWQIESMLSERQTREALLSCKFLLELIACLKELAQLTITNFGECKLIAKELTLSPVVAYLNLSIYFTLDKRKTSDDLITESRRKRHKYFNDVSISGVQRPFWRPLDSVIEELLGWARRLPHEPSVCLSDGIASSSFPHDSDKHRIPAQGARPHSSEVCFSHRGVLRMMTAILRSTLDAFELGLIVETSVQSAFVKFACSSVMWILDATKLESSIQNASAGETELLREHKELWCCVKATSTYAAKLVYLVSVLKPSPPCPSYIIIDLAFLADCILDLITISEQQKKPCRWPPLLPALKPWIPDLLIAVTRIPLLLATQGSQIPTLNNSSSPDEEENIWESYLLKLKQPFKSWLHYLAILAFDSTCSGIAVDNNNIAAAAEVEAQNESQSGLSSYDDYLHTKETKGGLSSATNNLLTAIIKLFQKGNPEIVEAFALMVVAFANECVHTKTYWCILGCIYLVCKNILECRGSQAGWGEGMPKKVLLAGLKHVYCKVRVQVSPCSPPPSSSSLLYKPNDEQMLVLAERLLRETIHSECFRHLH